MAGLFKGQFGRNLEIFENATESPEVITTGTGDDGSKIEALQLKLPLVLPDRGGKARFGRNEVEIHPSPQSRRIGRTQAGNHGITDSMNRKG